MGCQSWVHCSPIIIITQLNLSNILTIGIPYLVFNHGELWFSCPEINVRLQFYLCSVKPYEVAYSGSCYSLQNTDPVILGLQCTWMCHQRATLWFPTDASMLCCGGFGTVLNISGPFNSLWPSDAIWRQGSRSKLVQVMACCLTAPRHYLNQCWLIIRKVLWHSWLEGIITRRSEDTNQ